MIWMVGLVAACAAEPAPTVTATPTAPAPVPTPEPEPEPEPPPPPDPCDPFTAHPDPSPVLVPYNVVLVIMDDVGVELISGYGIQDQAAPTPVIDSLMSTGVRFTRAYAQPWCSPTRAELMTGRYARDVGIGRAIEPEQEVTSLPLDTYSLAEVLHDSPFAYTSALFGKWHLTAFPGDPLTAPERHGFDHYDGTIGNLTTRIAIDGNPQTFFDWENVENGVVERRQGYITTDTFAGLGAWVHATPEPWFAWVGLQSAHTPVHIPPGHVTVDNGLATTSREYRTRAMVTDIDTQLGGFLDAMDPDLRSRTVVIVLGDNGSSHRSAVGEYDGRPMKSQVYEGGIHVPLVIDGPVVANPGAVQDALVSLPDLYATIADLAGVDAGPIDGASLLPLLAGTGPHERQWVFATAFEPNGSGPYDRFQQTIRGPRYKLVRTLDGDSLYDLEGRNLEGDPVPEDGPAEALAAWDAYGAILDGCFGDPAADVVAE
jgi:arylsulfatase A-like enzyme